jgi:hypothetical protein
MAGNTVSLLVFLQYVSEGCAAYWPCASAVFLEKSAVPVTVLEGILFEEMTCEKFGFI